MKAPSPDGLRMIYGYCLLTILGFLAARIALGHVEEATSFGLVPVLTTLGVLAGGFTQWAFGSPRVKDDSNKDKPEPPKEETT